MAFAGVRAGAFCRSTCCFLPLLMNESDLSGFNPITDGVGNTAAEVGRRGEMHWPENAHPSPKKLAENKYWDLSSISHFSSLHNLGLVSSFVIT